MLRSVMAKRADESSSRPPGSEHLTPAAIEDYRAKLTRGEDIIHPDAWAGAIPAASGIAPRLRIGASRWFNVAVAPADRLRLAAVRDRSGEGAARRPERRGVHPAASGDRLRDALRSGDAWVAARAALHESVLPAVHHPRRRADPRRSPAAVLDAPLHARKRVAPHAEASARRIRCGRRSRTRSRCRSTLASQACATRSGSRAGGTSACDVLWLANGIVFYVLLFASGEWRRLVPTSWHVFPDAASVLLQYLSLDWPADHGWAAYNGLQILAYFITVFVAAPLALVTGLGMSPALSTRFKRISKPLSIQVARSLHFLVLCWFLVFIVVHVTLVFTTGLLRNLNHIYSGTDASNWVGFWCVRGVDGGRRGSPGSPQRRSRCATRASCSASATRSSAPRSGSSSTSMRRPASTARRTSRRTSGTTASTPTPPEYRALFDGKFADYRLRVHGLVENPVELSLAQTPRAAPPRADHAALLHPGLVRDRASGAASRCRRSSIWSSRSPRRSGSSSTRSATGPTRACYYDAHPIEQMRYAADDAGLRHERRSR